MSKSVKKSGRSKFAASNTLATLCRLRSMLSFIQAWIEEGIARTHSSDDVGAATAVAGLDSMLNEILQVYRESDLSSGKPT